MTKKVTRLDHLIGGNLRKLRMKKNITAEELARSLAIPSNKIASYEAGNTRISAKDLYGCSKFLGVEMIYFFTDINNEFGRAYNPRQEIDISLSPEEERRILFKFSEVENAVVRNRLFELFLNVKKQ